MAGQTGVELALICGGGSVARQHYDIDGRKLVRADSETLAGYPLDTIAVDRAARPALGNGHSQARLQATISRQDQHEIAVLATFAVAKDPLKLGAGQEPGGFVKRLLD